MANIKELKKKIKSTKSTLKITQAMKLVSAAKLAKAQQNILNSRPYAQELEETIKVVSALAQGYDHEYLHEKKENKKTVLLVISSDKGLCGSYNSQLAKKVKRTLEESGDDVKCFFIGKKVRDLLSNESTNKGKTYKFTKVEPSFVEMEQIGVELSEMFKTGEVGKVLVAYNVFQSAIAFTPTVKQLLPIALDQSKKEELKEKFPFDFKYEPNPTEILNTLIPQAYISSLYTSLLDAIAAEHGSRMSAMDSASGNCKKAIKTLTIKMNKLRQAAITTELIEVVSGAESLNG
ncbi:MAG: ATP synthase F1 subunit gamma [Bacteriovoracaceae bacterium]|jgi:F-type H+-transporting ATPase subunit gamma|nr:ATP synthase F1 subunit gamma [Bacteriovoracaceae bacterium]